MEFKKPRESLVQNITFMAMMAAINVVFVVLTTFVPVLVFLIVFILPLTSVLVTLHCKKIYFPIYAVATIGLCLICTIWKIDDTIFYVIPSIITGFVFGLLVQYKVPSFWIIISTTIIQIGFTYASMPLIKLMTGRDIVEVFASAFGILDFKYLSYVVPCFIFFIALGQEIIAYFIIADELPKFGYELNEPKNLPLSLFICLNSAIVLSIIFIFIYGPLSYLFMLFALLLAIYSLIYLIKANKPWIYASLVGGFILALFLFAICYPLVKEPLGLVFINIYFFIVSIIVFINNYLFKQKNIATIK